MEPGSIVARAISLGSTLALLAGLAGCTQCSHGARRPSEARRQIPSDRPPVPLPPGKLAAADRAGRPTLVLTPARLAALRESARRQTPAWKRARAVCDEQAKGEVRSGYQGWDWAHAIADLGLCWHATGDARYGRSAVAYLSAMLDDRFVVGDGKGGADVVRHDSGYGIRTFGAYTALGYDWLRSAPGMTLELRKRMVQRLDAWIDWYSSSGYLADHPLANYFWGYLTTLGLAGLAVGDEAPQGARWRAETRRLLETKVLPAFSAHLSGGNWPEGWQYGEYVAVEAALLAEAHATRLGIVLAEQMPWFSELVQHHVHALSPDKRTVYGGGTWGERPSKPSALALTAATLVLDRLDPERAAQARWMIDSALPPLMREEAWAALLTDRPDAPRRDPRRGAALSRLHRGTGLTLMRSDWTERAVWVSFQAGPRLTPDHQHKDQGHFELTRGSDWLLIDSGDSEGGATINHNCLLIDDRGELITYSPNQAVWGTEVRTTRYGDDGKVVVVTGELADAWTPACVRDGCTKRAVDRATRTLVYVRPALVVVHDRVALQDDGIRTTWAAHLARRPEIEANRASAVVGRSRVDVFAVAPATARIRALREPNGGGEGPHRASSTWGPNWRLEVEGPTGDEQRQFLHWITTDDARAAPPAAPAALSGSGLTGALGAGPERRIAVLLADDADGGKVSLSPAAESVVIAGLEPGARYDVELGPGNGCVLELRRGAALVAGSGGFVRLELSGCRRR